MQHISLGQWVRGRAVIVDVMVRTLLYTTGVFIVLLLEKAFEGRYKGSGLGNGLVEAFQHHEVYHALAQTIGVGGSLLVFNVLSVIRRHFGVSELRRLFFATSMGDLEAKETARASVGKAKGPE